MSQSRQSNATAAAPAGTFQEADTLVDAYAEDLMDEIFEDVDRILAGEESAIYADPGIQASQGTQSLLSDQSVTVPAMIVPITATQAVEQSAKASTTEAKTSSAKSDKPKTWSSKLFSKKRLGNFMLGVLCLSGLTAAGIWWMRQQPNGQTADSSTAPTALPTASEEAVLPAISQEAAFGEYLKRSLGVIRGERSAQTETQSPGAIATVPGNPSGNQVTAGKPSNNVIERVFVPLLQPGSGNNQGSPSNVVTSPSLPAPNGASTEQPNTTATIPNISTTNTYELVGVLELGERSAALFEVNGTSQRVYIGETIGSSGWSIVSISNEEVVVRRNGEVRSIYIGQQF
ncbi:hypothetical protein Lepto7375DRAFT_5567 [Leptolyngbya sp. PCC 7375]|nr:hypothetical protein Lepto7375DRAFT_5567 [Leptolyngbya sp. PCC 7375]